MSSPSFDSQPQQKLRAKIEKWAMDFIDSCVSPDDGKARIRDIFNNLHSSGASQEILNYVGTTPPALAAFVRDRRHLWRLNEEEIHLCPKSFRDAIVNLVASIVENKNRAKLGEIFSFLQRNHPHAMAYLPAPTNGSSMESVKNLVMEFPKLFRLLRDVDGNDWTRSTALGQVVVECMSVVMDGVIMIGIAPKVTTTSLESKTGTEETIEGIAEVIRVTPAWGYLRCDVNGIIFVTPKACGGNGESLYKTLKLGARVFFQARPSSDPTQKYNNLPVKWYAKLVRQMTSEEREAPYGQLKSAGAESAAASSEMDRLSSSLSSMGMGRATASSPVSAQMSSSNSSKASSPQPKADQSGMKKLPTGLAEWMKKRQMEASAQNSTTSTARHTTPSPNTLQRQPIATASMHPNVQDIEDELDIDSAAAYNDQYLTEAARYLGNGLTEHSLHHRSTIVADPPANMRSNDEGIHSRHNYDDFVGAAAAAEAEEYPECADIGVQTDATDEELLLRLLRQAPELLDLVRVVMRQ